MTLQLNRRALAAGLLAAIPLPSVAVAREPGERLPAHADFWSGLPLPSSLAEAWARLTPTTQAEIGTAVIGMYLAEYISGEMHGPENQFDSDDLGDPAWVVNDSIMGKLPHRLWTLFPELYGPDGDHPRWALAGGFAR